ADVVVSPNSGKMAYVTFLAGNKDYWMGVVGLAKGLRKVKSAYPLVVAILPDVPEEHRQILVAQGCIIREIEPVHPPENPAGYSMAYFFVEYEKVIYLDGDIQVFSNIDHLFDAPCGYLYAVSPDCFCEISWCTTPQYKIGYCQQSPEKVTWPVETHGSPPPLYFNAGMLVFEPNLATYEDLIRVVQVTTPTCFAEQRHLQANLIIAMLWRHPERFDLDQISVVHYCANGSKPWKYNEADEHMDREDVKMLVKKWWEIYEDSSLDYKNFVETESKLNPNPIIGALASKETGGDGLTNLAPCAA
ncbi:hypothetical protein EUTSA_v10027432mg, partial [Eutrema salsugineum]